MIGQHMSIPARFSSRQRYLVSLADQLGQRFAQLEGAGDLARRRRVDLHDSGFIRLAVPTEHGGHSANAFDAALLLEHLACGDVETATALLPMLQLVGWLAETNAASAPLFLSMCRAITGDGAVVYPALEGEPGVAEDGHGAAPLIARPAEKGWLLDGELRFPRTSLRPDYILAPLTLLGPEAQPSGQAAAALIPVDVAHAHKSGWHEAGPPHDQHVGVSLRQHFVAQQHLTRRLIIGGRPHDSAAIRLGWQQLTLAAVYLGATQGLWNSVGPALARQGPAAQHDEAALGTIMVSLTGARTILYHAAQSWVGGPQERSDALTQAVTARALCGQAATSVLEQSRVLLPGPNAACAALERALQRLRQGHSHDQSALLRIIGRAAMSTSVAA